MADGVEEAEVEGGKGIFVLVLGAAFNVTGLDGACEEVDADDFSDSFITSNGN